MDGGPNSKNKAAFTNFSGVVWTGFFTVIISQTFGHL